MNRRDPGFDIGIVVADVLIGFLCVVFLLFASQPRFAKAQKPPDEVQGLLVQLRESRARTARRFELGSTFSSVRVRYAEKLLFSTCEWALSNDGQELLREHFSILQKYISTVERIQIEGHADSRPAEGCPSLRRAGLRRDNWILSSLRALEVRDFLESIVGAHQNEGPNVLEKIEAVGRGAFHPLVPDDPASETNRRIELTIQFVERSRLSVSGKR